MRNGEVKMRAQDLTPHAYLAGMPAAWLYFSGIH